MRHADNASTRGGGDIISLSFRSDYALTSARSGDQRPARRRGYGRPVGSPTLRGGRSLAARTPPIVTLLKLFPLYIEIYVYTLLSSTKFWRRGRMRKSRRDPIDRAFLSARERSAFGLLRVRKLLLVCIGTVIRDVSGRTFHL